MNNFNSPEDEAKARTRGLRWLKEDKRDTRPSRKRKSGTPPRHIKEKLSIPQKEPTP
jgi:hypothetical protein